MAAGCLLDVATAHELLAHRHLSTLNAMATLKDPSRHYCNTTLPTGAGHTSNIIDDDTQPKARDKQDQQRSLSVHFQVPLPSEAQETQPKPHAQSQLQTATQPHADPTAPPPEPRSPQLQPNMVALMPTARMGPPRRSVSFNRAQRVLCADDVWRPSVKEFEADCKVVGMLGKGAFADVYKVKVHGQWAALKVLRPKRTKVPCGVVPEVMFFREARALKYCKHSNIVGCLGLVRIPAGIKSVGDPNSSHWAILQELLQEGSLVRMPLQQMSNPHSRIYSTTEALQWCLDIAQAVAHMHSLDPMVIHRDLKLENVLLAREGGRNGRRVARLSDFGLHTLLDQQQVDVVFIPGQAQQDQANNDHQQDLEGGQGEQQQQQQQQQQALTASDTSDSEQLEPAPADGPFAHRLGLWGAQGTSSEPGSNASSSSSSSSDGGSGGSFHSATDAAAAQHGACAAVVSDAPAAPSAAAPSAGAADAAATNAAAAGSIAAGSTAAGSTTASAAAADSAAPSRFMRLTAQTLRRLTAQRPDTPMQPLEVRLQQSAAGDPFRRVSIQASVHGSSPVKPATAATAATATAATAAMAVAGATARGSSRRGWEAHRAAAYGAEPYVLDGDCSNDLGQLASLDRMARLLSLANEEKDYGLSVSEADICFESLTSNILLTRKSSDPTHTAPRLADDLAPLARAKSTGSLITPGAAGAPGFSYTLAHTLNPAVQAHGHVGGAGSGHSDAASSVASDAAAASTAAAAAGKASASTAAANGHQAQGPYRPSDDVSTSAASRLFERLTASDEDDDVLDAPVAVPSDAPQPVAAVAAVLHYDMTGLTGSYMYMAPEVFRREPYSEKADIFSLGVIVYQLLARNLLLFTHTRAKSAADVERYAEKVSRGYRPKRPSKMPEHLYAIIEACWSHEPCDRPGITWVVQQLTEALEQELGRQSAGSKAIGAITRKSLGAAGNMARRSVGNSAGPAAATNGGAVAGEAGERANVPGGCGCVVM